VSTQDPVDKNVAPEKKAPSFFSDLSIPQVIAGALAAVTTAFIASHIGVAGTLIGAALGSVIATISTAMYKRSIISSHTVVQKVVKRTDLVPETQRIPTSAKRSAEREEVTASDVEPVPTPTPQMLPDLPDSQDIPIDTDTLIGTSKWEMLKKLNWRMLAVSAVISLLVAIVVLLGIEKISGQPIAVPTNTITRIVETPMPTPTETTIIIKEVPVYKDGSDGDAGAEDPDVSPTPVNPEGNTEGEEQTPPIDEPAQEAVDPVPGVENPQDESPEVQEPEEPVVSPTTPPTPAPTPAPKPTPTPNPAPSSPVTPKPTPTPTPTPSPESKPGAESGISLNP
jgi:hypothetical protein